MRAIDKGIDGRKGEGTFLETKTRLTGAKKRPEGKDLEGKSIDHEGLPPEKRRPPCKGWVEKIRNKMFSAILERGHIEKKVLPEKRKTVILHAKEKGEVRHHKKIALYFLKRKAVREEKKGA